MNRRRERKENIFNRQTKKRREKEGRREGWREGGWIE